MLLLNLLSNPLILIGFVLAISLAISVHESAHAWTAWRLGDSTARQQGRISLNPLKHLDPWGTIFLLLAGFGWGKPVPINPLNFKNPKIDELKVALSGPLSNLLFAILLSLIIHLLPLPEAVWQVFYIIIELNIVLMVFNLLPIPPLDGSTILQVILPESAYATLRQLGVPLLLVFVLFIFTTPYMTNFITFVTNYLMNILVG